MNTDDHGRSRTVCIMTRSRIVIFALAKQRSCRIAAKIARARSSAGVPRIRRRHSRRPRGALAEYHFVVGKHGEVGWTGPPRLIRATSAITRSPM